MTRPFVLRLALTGAKVVNPTIVGTGKLPSNQGHIHVLIDGKLVSMTNNLKTRITDLRPRRSAGSRADPTEWR